MTQKERQERSREEIYQAALKDFGAHGYDAVNMERICAGHGISKGMMYHYYTGKDELFLLCVERMYNDLKAHIERNMDALSECDVFEAIRDYFMLRECFFQQHPLQKGVFESAFLNPPQHLMERIRQLRAPIRELNRQFLQRQISRMLLRPGLDEKKVARYLESMESLFKHVLTCYSGEQTKMDLHAMLAFAGELLDMILFGVLRQPEGQCR